MKSIDLLQLSQMSQKIAWDIMNSNEQFCVCAEKMVGKRIQRYLAAEKLYLAGNRSIKARFQYFLSSVTSFPNMSFIFFWNAAVLRGFSVLEIKESDRQIEFHFSK